MGNQWSRDRWRHVTPKGQAVTPIRLEYNIAKTARDDQSLISNYYIIWCEAVRGQLSQQQLGFLLLYTKQTTNMKSCPDSVWCEVQRWWLHSHCISTCSICSCRCERRSSCLCCRWLIMITSIQLDDAGGIFIVGVTTLLNLIMYCVI